MSEETTTTASSEQAIQIIATLNSIPPHSSLSFVLDFNGLAAMNEIIAIVEDKFPKNMTNLRAAALETLTPLVQAPSNAPRNVNLTEEDIKALQKVQEILERELA